ncbi:MAG TPA: lytic transglycosylase domain-containing protein [Bryobacteraceae bacterium]|nr:lytic transglycosylase domain-containing protein [Bryobacteraceae bacterium]
MQPGLAAADYSLVKVLSLLLMATAWALAQNAGAVSPQEPVRKAMEEAAARQRTAAAISMQHPLAAQRVSIRKQAATAKVVVHDVEDSFLDLPWPSTVSMLSSDFSSNIGCDPVPKDQLASLIDQAAKTEGVSPDLLRAVASKESAFYPCAVSPKGAVGLMQLMPETQQDFHVTNAFDPGQSLLAGSRLLKQLLDRYKGNLPLALSAYNAGAGTVDRAGGIPQIPETQDYVSDIVSKLPPEPFLK